MTKLKIAVFSILASIGVHIYLTLHYYPLKFGTATGKAVCNISDKFNCDAVVASPFADLLGLPVSLLGAFANLVLLVFVLIYALRLSDELNRSLRYALYLSGLIAAASVVMGAISILFLSSYCPFCIVAYVLSFISFACILAASSERSINHIASDIKQLFKGSYTTIILLAAIPVASLITHNHFISQYGAENLQPLVNGFINEWKLNEKKEFTTQPSIAIGPERGKAKMVISEFADFLCIHCKKAAPTVHAFAKAHSDVRFEFYSFPLDGSCNEAIGRSNGIACHLAKLVYCGREQKLGWSFHDTIFEHQQDFGQLGTPEKITDKLKSLYQAQNVSWEPILNCVNSEEAQEAMQSMSKLGVNVGVRGTPTFFVNDKLLNRAQLLPVLRSAYESLD